jgi:3-methyladenine DNA glycosylase AlkD
MTTAKDIIEYMETLRNAEQRQVLMRFFKTGQGQYGEGDEFLGLKVPQTRDVVRAVAKEVSPEEVRLLMMSKWHEVRLCALLILVDWFERLATKRLRLDERAMQGRDEILAMYLRHADRVNNWDLVDLSAPKILGAWLTLPSMLPDGKAGLHREYKTSVLDNLASTASDGNSAGSLWKQRISMVCTLATSQQGDPSWCLRYAERHLHHPHDLMHKAVGWMLREMGKRCDMDTLRDFLRRHAAEMPRTTLRYAIEKMSDEERQTWMNVGRCRIG